VLTVHRLGLEPVVRLIKLAFYRWQRNTINPLSPYLPGIVLRINELERSQ
jgi:hypothetical protein